MSFVDQSLDLVRRAVKRIGKKPLAEMAGLSDAILRNVGDPDFSPTARTLRRLEAQASIVEAETPKRTKPKRAA